MNDANPLLAHWQDRRQTEENLRQTAWPPESRVPLDGRTGLGICRIVSVDTDDFSYQITQQVWHGTDFGDAGDAGLVDRPARDYKLRTTGQVDQFVPFWLLPNRRGGQDVWIDVTVRLDLSVVDSDDNTAEKIEQLQLDGENGITAALDGGDGLATVMLNLPQGQDNAVGGGDLLVWIQNPAWPQGGYWSTVAAEAPSSVIPGVYYVGSTGPQFVESHLARVTIGGTDIDGVSRVSLDTYDAIEIDLSSFGTAPEKTVEALVHHATQFAGDQSVTVRNAAGDGTITLQFDKFGHFTGTA
jgi:hypothetical protein